MPQPPRTAWLAFVACLAVALGCGGSEPEPLTVAPAPKVELTSAERDLWAPAPPDGTVAVLDYHGIGPPGDFADPADAGYGVDAADFAKQMTLVHNAGYRTITLAQFVAFAKGEHPDLPSRPLLLTFDDGRRDSYTGSDAILEELGYRAVLFVDTGHIGRDPEYLTYDQLDTVNGTGRWELQLHAGPNGHGYVKTGPGENDTGPFYAYKQEGESYDRWRRRAEGDLTTGADTIARQFPDAKQVAFAPPYGSYGQDGTNDDRIPAELLAFLNARYQAVFTQDRSPHTGPGDQSPYGRFQVTRAVTGGELHNELVGG